MDNCVQKMPHLPKALGLSIWLLHPHMVITDTLITSLAQLRLDYGPTPRCVTSTGQDLKKANQKHSPVLTINGRFLSQRLTGAQRYAHEIVEALDEHLRHDRQYSSIKANLVTPNHSGRELHLGAINTLKTSGGGPLWDQFVLAYRAKGVLLSLCNMGPVFAANHIICIHDLNYLMTPDSYSHAFRAYYRLMQPLVARNAARVVTSSSFSARMLSNHGFCSLDKITIVPNGHEHVRRWQPLRSQFNSPNAIRRPFVFALGSRARHKNIYILFSIAKELDLLGLDLLVAGGTDRLFSAIPSTDIPPNVRMLGAVTDDDLAALYKAALCLTFPSIVEGFGLPVLEALALGCPVVASNAASIPEVCGDAALFADPTSPRAWLDQIRRLRTEPGLIQSLQARGFKQAERLSWKKAAQLYLRLIETILQE
jgi:glycosyltransferase involved in cell wall biosynthesis